MWIKEALRGQDWNLYELAVMTDGGAEFYRAQPSNLCQDSYSVAKAFTMTAVGLLCDAGKLSVTDSVADVLGVEENADPRWGRVTVDCLLRHRAGFAADLLDIDTQDASAYDGRDYLARVLAGGFSSEPGTEYRYTDAAFYLLSRIVAARAGQPLDRVLADALFRKMDFREAAWSRCPDGHPIGATGLYVAARDMVKLGWMLLNRGDYCGRRVLSEDWVDTVMQRGYEILPCGEGWFGKGGMNGQMLIFHPERRIAAAWHAFEPRNGEKWRLFMQELLLRKFP